MKKDSVYIVSESMSVSPAGMFFKPIGSLNPPEGDLKVNCVKYFEIECKISRR